MAKISTYPIVTVPTLDDMVIGTDVEDLNNTRNFPISDILGLIGFDTYVPYVGATKDIDLGVYGILSTSYAVAGGTSSQFLKADGTLDSTAYTSQIRTLTINGTTYDLSANRTWSLPTIDTFTTTGTGGAATYSLNTLNIPIYQSQGNYITQLTGEVSATGPGVVTATLSNNAVISKVLTGLNITGGSVISTDSILEAFGKVQNQINSLIGGSIYKGTWNASTNTPTLTSSVGILGWYYIVNVPGNTNLNGITDWNLGDWAIFDGSAWQKVDNTDAVISVNGYTGIVNLTYSDVGAVPTGRTLTINGTAYDLTADRSWSVGTVTSIGTSGPLTGGTITGSGTLGITQSGAASDGYLSSTDWNTFNNKLDTNIYTADGILTGDRTVNSGGYILTLNPNMTFGGNITGIVSKNDLSGNYSNVDMGLQIGVNKTFDGSSNKQMMTLNIYNSVNANTSAGSGFYIARSINARQSIGSTSSSQLIQAINSITSIRDQSTDISTNANNYLSGISVLASQSNLAGSSIYSGTIIGVDSTTQAGTGTVNNMYGFKSAASFSAFTSWKSSTVNNFYAFHSSASVGTSSTITGLITNFYGLYLATPTVGATGTITNRWGVYATDSAMKHYLNGTVLIGSATDSTLAKLQVTGAIQQSSVLSSMLKVDSNGVLVAAISGTDYQPAGTYLTGGGTIYYLPMWSGTTSLTDSIISYSSNVVNYNYNSAAGATVNYINTNGTTYTYTIQMNNSTRITYHSYTDGSIIQRINSNDVSKNLSTGQFILPYYTTTSSFTGTSVGYLGFDASGNIITVAAPSLTGYVPYTGATANVDLGEYELMAGQVEFDQSPTGTAGVAVMRWNNTDGTVDLGLKGGNVTLQVGQEQVIRVVNKTGADLLEAQYRAVRIRLVSEGGAQGQRLAVLLAQGNNDPDSTTTLGLVTETIADNQEGFITTSGEVRGINTTGSLQGETWSDGDILYLSPTVAGGLTIVKPTAPNHLLTIGYVVYAHINNGKIFVKVDNGYELGELHDCYVPTPSNNDGIFWSTANSRYQNNSIIGALGYTPYNATNPSGFVNYNIYTSDGTLAGDRYVNANNNNLWIDNVDTLRVSVGTVAINQVALFEAAEPNINIKALGVSNSAAVFLSPSAGFYGAIHNRTGGGLEFYVGATPSVAMTIGANLNLGIGGAPNAINSLEVTRANQWSAAFIGNMGGARTPSATYGIHLGWNYATSGESNILWGTGVGTFPYLTFSSWDGTTKTDRMVLSDTGKLTLKQYLTTTSFTGTAIGYIAFDSTGGLITVPVPGGAGLSGSGTATEVAFWSSSSTLTSSSNFYWDNVNGRLGINNASPSDSLDVVGTSFFTDTRTYSSGTVQSATFSKNLTIPNATTVSSSVTLSSILAGGATTFQGDATIPSSSTLANILSANSLYFTSAGTITMTQAAGIRAASANQILSYFGGTASSTVSHYAANSIYGFYNLDSGTITPIITNSYMLLINDMNDYSHTFTFGNRWGIYQAGVSEKNYFGGETLIRTLTSTGAALTIGPSTAASASINMIATGSVLETLPDAGDMEVDANGLLYYTHNNLNRGVVSSEQFVCLNNAYALGNNTNLQKAFNATTNGALEVKGATSYFFECYLIVTGMSGTSGNFGFNVDGAGTATTTSVSWFAHGLDSSNQTTAANIGGVSSAAAGITGNIITAATGTSAHVFIKGVVRVNAAGTIIPSIQLTTANAASVGTNSWFRIWPIGTNTVTNVGNWT